MKIQDFIAFISLMIFMLATSGCTTQAWYESLKQGAENNCRSQPPSESERCLKNLNKQTYEEYEKERSNEKPP